MRIKPMGDKIVVREKAPDDITAGGVIIPGAAQRKPMMADVMAVGRGTLLESGEYAPVECVVGDVVLYGEGSGTPVEVEGVEYIILRQAELLGILAKSVAVAAVQQDYDAANEDFVESDDSTDEQH